MLPTILARTRVIPVIVAAVGLLLPTASVRAADIDKVDCSIKEIPADAAFYIAFLRNREQFEAVRSSKAWAALMAMPGVKQGLDDALQKMEDDNETGPLVKWFKAPENKAWVELLLDMVSQEVFISGGDGVAKLGDLYGKVMTTMQVYGFQKGIESKPGQDAKPEDTEVARVVLDELSRNLKDLEVPDAIVGFRLSNPKQAAVQLRELEKLIRTQMDRKDETKVLKDHLKWKKIAGGDFLTLAFDSALVVKGQEQNLRKYERKPGDYDALIKRLGSLTFFSGIGIRGNYLLVAYGSSPAVLEKLGKGPRLIDRPELKPLAKHADQRLTSISYQSKTFNAQADSSYWNVSKWIAAGRKALPNSKLSPELRTRIEKDLEAFDKDWKASQPLPGAELSYSFRTARGYESYAYDYRQNLPGDGSKPLTILDHVGGDPYLVFAGRSKYSPQTWQRFVHWIKVGYRYAEEFIPSEGKPGEVKKNEELLKTLTKLDEVTGKMFLPSMADGQWAFVLDGKLASKQWTKSLPELSKEVAVPEPALIYGVSDAALLRKSMGEYRGILNTWLAAANKLTPDKVPDLQIPAPQSRKIKSGTMYYYPLPEAWGLEPRLLPNAALSPRFAALTLSQEHSERLLTGRPPKGFYGPLADRTRPLSGASYLNWAGLIDLFGSWTEQAGQITGNDPQGAEALKQARAVFDLMKVFRGFASATYTEGQAQVTHTERVIADLK